MQIKNKKILIIFFSVLLLLIIILVFATKEIIKISKMDDVSIIEQEANKAKENSNKINTIINRYYPQEYEEINKNIANEAKNAGIVDIINSQLSENEKAKYDLILKILENENLPDEDSNLLKDYLEGDMYNIKKDENLKDRVDKVLE